MLGCHSCATGPGLHPAPHLAVDSLALASPCCRRSLNDFMLQPAGRECAQEPGAWPAAVGAAAVAAAAAGEAEQSGQACRAPGGALHSSEARSVLPRGATAASVATRQRPASRLARSDASQAAGCMPSAEENLQGCCDHQLLRRCRRCAAACRSPNMQLAAGAGQRTGLRVSSDAQSCVIQSVAHLCWDGSLASLPCRWREARSSVPHKPLKPRCASCRCSWRMRHATQHCARS